MILFSAQILFKKGVPLLMPNKSGARGIHTAASKVILLLDDDDDDDDEIKI